MRHRDYFLPARDDPSRHDDDHAEPPTGKQTVLSVALLLVALVSVVLLAKKLSPVVKTSVLGAGLPLGLVGVVIAATVLMPEGLAAVRAARANRLQTSMNLAYGSAMASIGLTIPTIAVASIWIPDKLSLGLEPTQMVLLLISAVVAVLTVTPGRAKTLQGWVHLALLAAYLFMSVRP